MFNPEKGWVSETYPDSQDVLIYDENNFSQPASRTVDFPDGAYNIFLSGSKYFTLSGNTVYFRPEERGEFSCIISFKLPSQIQISATQRRTGYKFPGKYLEETEGVINCWQMETGVWSVQVRLTGRGVKPELSINYIQDDKFNFGTVPVNDAIERQANLFNIGTGDLYAKLKQEGEGKNISGTKDGTEIWIQESSYDITQVNDFDEQNTKFLLRLIYSPSQSTDSFYYILKILDKQIPVQGKASRPLSEYGWFNNGDWEGLSATDLKYVLRDITNAIHERERALGYGEINELEPAPIRIATINGTPKSGDKIVGSRAVKLTGSCDPGIKAIYVNGRKDGINYTEGETTWEWSGQLVDGKNRIIVTAYNQLNVFCFPDEMIIYVDRFAPKIIDVESFNIGDGLSKIRLKFNEDINIESLSPEKFTIEPDEILPINKKNIAIVVGDPAILAVQKIDTAKIELITTKLAENIRYKLKTIGLQDIVGNETNGEEVFLLGGEGKPPGVELSVRFRSGNYSTGNVNLSVTGLCNKIGETRYLLVHNTATNIWGTLPITPSQKAWSWGVNISENNITNIIFYEVDLAGAISDPTYLRIIYTGATSPPQYAPPILSSPSSLSTYALSSTILLQGTSESQIVSINNKKITVVNDNWSYLCPLNKGANTIEIRGDYWINDTLYQSEPIYTFVEYDPDPLTCSIFPLEYLENGSDDARTITKYINKNGIAVFIIKFNKLVKISSFDPSQDLRLTGATFISSTNNSFNLNGEEIADTWIVNIKVPLVETGRISLQAISNTAQSITGTSLTITGEVSFFYDKKAPQLYSVTIHGLTPDAGSTVEVDSVGPVNVIITFTKPIKNFSVDDISLTSNANIINFRAQRFVVRGETMDQYLFAISPRVQGATILMDISPRPFVTDYGGNQIDLNSKGGPYTIKYKHPDIDNPWHRAFQETNGRIFEEEPYTYWLKPDIWIKPCDPNMVTVYWVRPGVGKSSRRLGIMSNPSEDYFVGMPLSAMFTERDVYFVTKECDEEEGDTDINSTIQEISRVYDLAGGTMTAQMSEFNNTCRYRLHKQEWRVPYMPMGDLINAMRLAIEKLVNKGHRKGPTHYISRFCHWVDEVPYKKILNPITGDWEIEYLDYGFWKIWTMEELLFDVNTKADWWDEEDIEKDRAMWVNYTKGSTLNKKIWLQLRDILNRLTCVKWDIGICGLPGNCELPVGFKGSVKKFGYNVCDRGWNSLALALSQGIDGDSKYARGGYYPIVDYSYKLQRSSVLGVQHGFVAEVREVIPNESIAYPDVGWGSGARSITIDEDTIPDWSTAYIKGSWVDTWIVALLSAEGITSNNKDLGYSTSYAYGRYGEPNDFLYGGCIRSNAGASISISEETSGVSWSISGGSVLSGGTEVFNMGDYTSPNLNDPNIMESNACVRSIYTLHQTFDWGGICYARGGSGILKYGEDFKDWVADSTPTGFNFNSSAGDLEVKATKKEVLGREIRVEEYTYPFTWQQDMVGGGPFGSSGVIGHPARPSIRIRGHVKFSLRANPVAYGNNLFVPGGAANSFIITDCMDILHYRDTTSEQVEYCGCRRGQIPSRGQNGFALHNCDPNLHEPQSPGVSGADYPSAWTSFRSTNLGNFFGL